MIEPSRRITTWLAILAVVIASSGDGAMRAANRFDAVAENVYENWRPAKYHQYKSISWALVYFSAAAFPSSVLLSSIALFRSCRHPPRRPLWPILALVTSFLSALPWLVAVYGRGMY
jgi:hypothetical protein